MNSGTIGQLYLYNSLVWGNTATTASGRNIHVEGTTANGGNYKGEFIVRSSLIENAGLASYSGTYLNSFSGTYVITNRSYDLAFPSGLWDSGPTFWIGKEVSIFAGYAGGNYRLKDSLSLAVNKGNDDATNYPSPSSGDQYYPNTPAAFATKHSITLSAEAQTFLDERWNQDLDLDENVTGRFNGGVIDIGCYEL
jgi:hypothetical protein